MFEYVKNLIYQLNVLEENCQVKKMDSKREQNKNIKFAKCSYVLLLLISEEDKHVIALVKIK